VAGVGDETDFSFPSLLCGVYGFIAAALNKKKKKNRKEKRKWMMEKWEN
jgi:hypothetical protein